MSDRRLHFRLKYFLLLVFQNQRSEEQLCMFDLQDCSQLLSIYLYNRMIRIASDQGLLNLQRMLGLLPMSLHM